MHLFGRAINFSPFGFWFISRFWLIKHAMDEKVSATFFRWDCLYGKKAIMGGEQAQSGISPSRRGGKEGSKTCEADQLICFEGLSGA
jgi:hypothetical protein